MAQSGSGPSLEHCVIYLFSIRLVFEIALSDQDWGHPSSSLHLILV